MKRLSTVILLALPLASFADPQMMGMDPAKMQQMQKMLVEMQNCIQKIDKNELEKLKHRSEAMEKEVKALCQAGKRDAAMDKAMTYGKQMMNEPSLMQMQKCGEKARHMMPNMAESPFEGFSEDKYKEQHICDSM